ncbi:MAG: peptidoglycan-binding domain-containing protein [Sneathiellaceae bacterium]
MLLALYFVAQAGPAAADMLRGVKESLDDLDRTFSEGLGAEPRSAPAQAADPAPPAPPVRQAPSAAVRAVQERLNGLGYEAGPADGLYGPATRRAILAFQADNGLPEDGRITPALRTALAPPRKTPPPAVAQPDSRPAGPMPYAETLVRIGDGEIEHVLATYPEPNFWRQFYYAYLIALSDRARACGWIGVAHPLDYREIGPERLGEQRRAELRVSTTQIRIITRGDVRYSKDELGAAAVYLDGFGTVGAAHDLHRAVRTFMESAGCDDAFFRAYDENVSRIMDDRFDISGGKARQRVLGLPSTQG